MIKKGLVKELEIFYENIPNKNEIDWTKGIFQAIGFKEFLNYLKSNDQNKRTTLLEEAISELKQNTKHYAKSQLVWIKRLRNHTDLFQLDTSELTKWNENVKENAIQIVRLFLKSLEDYEQLRKFEPFFLKQIEQEKKEIWKKYYCDQCEKEYNGSMEWDLHLKSKLHKSRKRKLKKQSEEKKRKLDGKEEVEKEEEVKEKDENGNGNGKEEDM